MPIMARFSNQVLSPGSHRVRIAKIEEVKNIQDENKLQLQITLEAVGDMHGEPPNVRFWTSCALHPMGRLLPFIEAAIGRQLSSDELRDGFDVSSITGKELIVILKHATSQAGKTYSKPVDFLPCQN
jgi:hypothetical protein